MFLPTWPGFDIVEGSISIVGSRRQEASSFLPKVLIIHLAKTAVAAATHVQAVGHPRGADVESFGSVVRKIDAAWVKGSAAGGPQSGP